MNWPLLASPLSGEGDVVAARQRARQIAAALGFDSQDQVRIATSVSEVARNGLGYGGGGRVEYGLEGEGPIQAMVVTVKDKGPGIADLELVLSGAYRSRTGMGLGLIGARRLMSRVDIETGPAGTTVTLVKMLPRGAPRLTKASLARIVDDIRQAPALDPFSELRDQNRELLEAAEALRVQQDELEAVNRELAETNRGVLALYAELEDKAEELRRAGEARSRFHANISHELRTPIQSVLAISQLLLDRADGELTEEQERQVRYIRQSGTTLAELVNDLLDLAKTEAGRLQVKAADFTVEDLFGGLRGVLRPLNASDAVELLFEDAAGLPPLYSDETKIAQVLRNLISNALKFTTKGSVHVSAVIEDERVCFDVADTGIGIAPGDLARIFEEFEQVSGPHQLRAKGTGLGLALSRRLARLLGGDLEVASKLGEGSTFRLTVPRELPRPDPAPALPFRRALVIDDDETWRYAVGRNLSALGVEVVEAQDGFEGLDAAMRFEPDVVLLDLDMPRMDGFEVLRRLKAERKTAAIPVAVFTASTIDAATRERLKEARLVASKMDLGAEAMQSGLRRLAEAVGAPA